MRRNRRTFLASLPLLSAAQVWLCAERPASVVHTVRGPLDPARLGVTLMHEHVLVDFIGADKLQPGRYSPDEVFQVALPYLRALRSKGCDTLVECTPSFLGRDPLLLRRLSQAGGLNLLTNTGY